MLQNLRKVCKRQRLQNMLDKMLMHFKQLAPRMVSLQDQPHDVANRTA
jgi:hypothetical protein